MAYTFAGEYFDALEDATTGKPVPGVAVTVYATGTTTKATLYTDRTKGTATSNPTSTSVEGNLQFFTDPGRYDLLVNGRTLGPVTIYPDVNDVEDVTTLLNQLAAKVDTAGSGLTKTGTTLAADFGTAAGKVTQGNDSRLFDARTPVAHAHAESDVTNLGTDLGTKVDTAGTGLVKSGTTLRRASAGSTFANLAALPSAASNPGRLERTADAGVYESDGTTWIVLVPPNGTYALTAQNLADLANAATARTNLGLGTAATQPSTAFAPSTGIAESAVTNLVSDLAGKATVTVTGTSGAPTTGTAAAGAFALDTSGRVWVCLVAGTPGTWGIVGGPTFATLTELVAGTILNGNADIAGAASSPIFHAPFACTIEAARVVSWNGSITASDTDYWTVELRKYKASGGYSGTPIASKTTKVTGGEAVTTRVSWSFDLATFNATEKACVAGDIVALAFLKTGAPNSFAQPTNGQVRYQPS